MSFNITPIQLERIDKVFDAYDKKIVEREDVLLKIVEILEIKQK